MKRRITPYYVSVPDAPKEHVLDLSRLDGGLNTWELDYRIDSNQSPDMENMYWVDGVLSARSGQKYFYEEAEYGSFFSFYDREFITGKAICHMGEGLYCFDVDSGESTKLMDGLAQQAGTFFVFGADLYYLNGADYIKIGTDLSANRVEPYIPVVAVNREPNGTGGDLYQPENRLAAGKEIHFTADGTSKEYYLPYKELDETKLKVTVYGAEKTEGTDFTVNRTLGIVTFKEAPEAKDPIVLNGVKITCYKTDEDTINSILSCKTAIVYGGSTELCVIVGGPAKQPNAYFWSGVNGKAADPSYFPFDYYNLAGAADEYITGFGKQQSMLVIFKERSIGKAYFQKETIDGLDYLSLPFSSVNSKIGCNLPGTIQLVDNNLVFANTFGGVFMIADTSSAGENNVVRLSRNINGTESRPGLLYDLRKVSANAVSSLDDDNRYWIVANGHAYVWDYQISPYGGYEERLSWFYFTNMKMLAWFRTTEKTLFGLPEGKIGTWSHEKVDYGEPIRKKFTFATQYFKTYEVLKDILKVVIVVRSDTNTDVDITYKTDYEIRKDLTPIRAYSWSLTPRNTMFRSLSVIRFAASNIRRPGCWHIRHFSMVLENDEPYRDLSVVGAQIVYRYSGGDR